MSAVSNGQLENFYEAAFVGLKALDARADVARRFGPNADARWALFKGEMKEWERLELLMRDAAANHPAAFALLDGLAEDEPFGPEWPGPDAALSLQLLRDSHAPAPSTPGAVPQAAARAWRLTPQPLAREVLAEIAPATRILASGAGAVLSLAAYFEGRAELDLADQVLLVTDSPAERQLFGIAVMLPLHLAEHKARVLAGLIERRMPGERPWVEPLIVVPAHDEVGPASIHGVTESLPVPTTSSAQRMKVPEAWLSNLHRGGRV